ALGQLLNAKVTYADLDNYLAQPSRYFVQVMFNSVEPLLSRGRKFDYIFLGGVIHHIENFFPVLLPQLIRLLTRGGVIIVRDHDVNNAVTRWVVTFQHLFYSLKEECHHTTKNIAEYQRRSQLDRLLLSKEAMIQNFSPL